MARHKASDLHKQTIFYEVYFWMRHGRFPDLEDSMAHCTDEDKEKVRRIRASFDAAVAAGASREELMAAIGWRKA